MKRDDRRDVGVIWDEAKQPDSCSCHISPPCSACVEMHETVGGADLWSDLTDQDVSKYGHERFVPFAQYDALIQAAASVCLELRRAQLFSGTLPVKHDTLEKLEALL